MIYVWHIESLIAWCTGARYIRDDVITQNILYYKTHKKSFLRCFLVVFPRTFDAYTLEHDYREHQFSRTFTAINRLRIGLCSRTNQLMTSYLEYVINNRICGKCAQVCTSMNFDERESCPNCHQCKLSLKIILFYTNKIITHIVNNYRYC